MANPSQPITIEIDDHPIRWQGGPTDGDYLSRWIAAASQQSKLQLVDTSPDRLTQYYVIPEGTTFANGDPVEPSHHVSAIRAALGVPFLQRFLTSIQRIRISGRSLSLMLRRPAPHLPTLLTTVDLAPIAPKPNQSSGDYHTAYQVADDTYWLQPVSPKLLPVKLLVRHDHHGAPERYDSEQVDVTCATAFPLERLSEFQSRPDFHSRTLGIQMQLEIVPGRRSLFNDPSCRMALRERLSVEELYTKILGGMESSELSTTSVAESDICALEIGYWDYYPNPLVATAIAQQITDLFNVKTSTSIADFYNDRVTTQDLLLALRGPVFDAPIARYDLFNPGRDHSTLAHLLNELSSDPGNCALQAAFWETVRLEAPIIPVMDIEGHWLQRYPSRGCVWPPIDQVSFPTFLSGES